KMIREIDYKLIRDNYIARKHYSIDSIATNINLQLDSFFLLLLFGRDMYAYYQPLNRLYNSCIGLSAAVVSFAIPYAHLLTSRIKKIYFLVFLFSSSAIIISLSYYFFSRDVVMVFFGEKFSMERQYIFLF
ncbi:TPA: O58 family O-antigen flippase, partial [Escherichia coli]|nr:O58 family O-antigen flippase [Escherichia coli]